MNAATLASGAELTLFVYIVVSLTRDLISSLSKNATTSNWYVRVWAEFVGIFGAIFDYLMQSGTITRIGAYQQLKLGAAAATSAIIVYHIGQLDFSGAFDSSKTKTTTTTETPPTADAQAGANATVIPAT